MSREALTASMTELRKGLDGYLDEVAAGRHVIVTRYGKPVAVLVPVEWLGRLADAGVTGA